jgi:RHS repeat-associated protein
VLNAPGGSYGFQYEDGHILDEFGAGTGYPLLRRYVYGPNGDEPLVWYEGSGTNDRRYLVADERGSIVAVTDGTGAASALNSYDEYGIPGAGNVGRFQYTGQAWLAELGMYSYKARIYSPTMGRFLQPDPIGPAAGPNWYNYVNSDPVNNIDPSGLMLQWVGAGMDNPDGSWTMSYGWKDDGYTLDEFLNLQTAFGQTAPDFRAYANTSYPNGGGDGQATPREKSERGNNSRSPCTKLGDISASVDVGIFVGYGVGFSIGINWDLDAGVFSAFRSARSGKGIGLTAGLGINYSNSAISAGYSRTRNSSASVIGGYSMSAPSEGGPVSLSKGVISIGPKVGFEDSSTQNLTKVMDLNQRGEMLCRP